MKLTLVVLLIAVAAGIFLFYDPEDASKPDINVIEQSVTIDKHLSKHRSIIGDDYDGYRNHIYRVFTFSMYYFKNIENIDISERNKELIETALVYHDIGLWSHSVLAYLDPSIEFLKENLDLKKYTENELYLMESIIKYHHKITPFTAPNPLPFSNNNNNNENKDSNPKVYTQIVNAVKNSDLIDFSKGFFRKGISKSNVNFVINKIPNAGFHDTLNSIGFKFHGNDILTIIKEIIQIYYF